MTETLSEIILAQQGIRHFVNDNKDCLSLPAEVEKIIQWLDQGTRINRKKIKQLFDNVEKSVHKLQNTEITNRFAQLYSSIFDTIYNYEKDLITRQRHVQKFTRHLDAVQQTFREEIINSKQEYSQSLGVELDEYFNFFELNTDLMHRNYTDNFVNKVDIFKNRILPTIEKSVYNVQCVKKEKLYRDLAEMQNLFDEVDRKLETAKKQKTQQILKDRRYNWSDTFVWNNDQEYLDYAHHWKNDFVVDEFLGLIGQYVNWKYPIAYVEPNVGELTRHIISGDPFYVIDDRVLPYENLLKTLPKESQRKISRYDKKTATAELENSSVGMCVSWNNYPFMTQGKIAKDIKLVSDLLRPGGLFVCNYADAHSVDGAKFVEKNNVPVFWKERMDQFASENNLVEISSHEFNEYPFKLAVYGKIGKMPDLPVTNKIGLVLPNETHLQQLRQEHTEENTKQRALNSKLEQDLKRLQERDKLLKDLDEQRQLGKENLIEAKLQNAINHLNSMLAQYNNDYTHPSVLESILHVSKLTYSLGRTKDSKNIIKRVSRDIEKMSEKNLIARKFREWQDFLNNIDT